MATATPDSAQNAVTDSEEMTLSEIKARVTATHERIVRELAAKRETKAQIAVEIAELVAKERDARATVNAFNRRSKT